MSIWQGTVLNLDRLAIKASTASNATDAVVLSSGGRVWTTYICSGTTLSDGTCKKVSDLLTSQYTHALTIKWEGTAVTTFDQASAASLNIVGGTNVTVTPNATNNTITISANWWGGSWGLNLLSWANNKYCKYVENWRLSWVNCTYDGTSTNSNWSDLWILTGRKLFADGCTSMGGCNTDVLTPKDSSKPLYFESDFYHSWSFVFHTYRWSQQLTPATTITFDEKWVRVGEWRTFTNHAWISVGWIIVAWLWSTNNYIYMYASWYASDTNRHFEIMGSNELAVWTYSGAFIYFSYLTGNYLTNSNDAYNSYAIWVNKTRPNATMDINGTLKVWSNCAPAICDEDTVWTIMYYEYQNVWYYVACKKIGKTNWMFQFWWYNLLNWELIKSWNTTVSLGHTEHYDPACAHESPNPNSDWLLVESDIVPINGSNDSQ